MVDPNSGTLRTGGLYRFVRHPIYASYPVFDIAYVAGAFSWLNLGIAIVIMDLLYTRARLEERLLMRDPVYARYAETTRFRFIPGLL